VRFKINYKKNSDQILDTHDFFSNKVMDVLLKIELQKASDLHIEFKEKTIYYRGRVHGRLRYIAHEDDPMITDYLFQRWKDICQFDQSKTGVAQDSSFALTKYGCRYRAALSPGFGSDEAIVLRVIRDTWTPSLKKLHIPEDTEASFRGAIEHDKGMIIITGPTGSGKSSTLQALIYELDRKSLKVITLEDPVERVIPYVWHQQISPSFSWTEGIRNALRSDPDVILIGEIRDAETAQLAFEAAQTGHLVLTTIHTNDVPGTIDRLIGLGVDQRVLADNLLLVTAQRLFQRLCKECKEVCENGFSRNQKGCKSCDYSGDIGLVSAIEYVFKPDPYKILNFSKKEFPLNKTLSGEVKRLVSSGFINAQFLNIYGGVS